MQAQDVWAARLICEEGFVDDVGYLYSIDACFELSNGGEVINCYSRQWCCYVL